jgi:hypothetical protein
VLYRYSPGEDPDLGASIHGGDQLGLQVFEAAGLDEGGDDADAVGVGEEREDVPGEGIVGAAGGERRRRGVGAGREQVADAAFWIIDVAVEARDHVEVEVQRGVARGGAGVEAYVVAVGVEDVIEGGLHFGEQGEERVLFGFRGVEPGGDQALADDQRVAGGDRLGIGGGEGEGVFVGPGGPGGSGAMGRSWAGPWARSGG